MTEALLVALYIFVLAVFVGFEVIAKVPTLLHTPLMSGSNAISGIVPEESIIVGNTVLYGATAGRACRIPWAAWSWSRASTSAPGSSWRRASA